MIVLLSYLFFLSSSFDTSKQTAFIFANACIACCLHHLRRAVLNFRICGHSRKVLLICNGCWVKSDAHLRRTLAVHRSGCLVVS